MSAAIVFTLAVIFAGISYVRGYRSIHESKISKAGWSGLDLMTLLFVGLWYSGKAGNEPAAYGFGITLALSLAIMLLVGVASAIGRAMHKCNGQKK
jgi:hypothetical protein